MVNKQAKYLLLALFILVFCDNVLMAQSGKQHSNDTIVVKKKFIVYITDTVLTNWMVELGGGPAFLKFKEQEMGNLRGSSFFLNFSYFHNSTWYKLGVDFLSYHKNMNYTDSVININEVVRFKDTIQTIGQINGTDTLWTSIPYRKPYLANDTTKTKQSRTHKNVYRLLEVPLLFGWVIDKPQYSITLGTGVKLRYLLTKSDNIGLNNVGSTHSENGLGMAACFESSFNYYLFARLSVGLDFKMDYNLVNPGNYLFPKIVYSTGIKISCFF